MCNKNNNNNARKTRRGKRKSKSSNSNRNINSNSVSLKPSRTKTRTKTRKPKYLSLVHLEENLPQMSTSSSLQVMINKGNDDDDDDDQQQQQQEQEQEQQLNLFPLHPENLVEDRDHSLQLYDDHVSLFFNTNVHAPVTLTGLLDDESTTTTTTTTTTTEENPLSPSLTYGYSCEDHHSKRLSLVRSAMKGIRNWKKEREESEEKWVVYSEVVEKQEMEEVSSCGGDGDGDGDGGGGGFLCTTSSSKKKKKLLALKLDYEEIMNAWSDKGPLYIEGGESPQTVPDLHVLMDGWGSVSNVWMVPEMVSSNVGSLKIKEEFDGKLEDLRKGHREASVLRYKEKRQNRLFSKRIRYEVRKVNAEKRPRLKGRFVKRD